MTADTHPERLSERQHQKVIDGDWEAAQDALDRLDYLEAERAEAERELEGLKEIAVAALGLCESINECHGCMDQDPSSRREHDRLNAALHTDQQEGTDD